MSVWYKLRLTVTLETSLGTSIVSHHFQEIEIVYLPDSSISLNEATLWMSDMYYMMLYTYLIFVLLTDKL